jgi:adenine-specific DNA-methyltransferase
MQKITADSPESKSPDLVAENIAKLKELFPELLTEGENGSSVNLDVLKQLVGDQTLSDAEEKYGLNWHGKRKARQLALAPSTGTLRPCPEDSVDWDTTQNLMIEGDNLEVLKLLQKSYAGKVKLIYIDPPYNTGKDFVYPDNFKDNIKNYLELTGQTGEGGNKLSSNPETSGRFHTDWLNMMYPRLKLARNLLKDDGIVMVSVDDNEVSNIRRLLDEIFGEEQFEAQIVIQSNKRGQTYKQIAKTHEFLILYSKSESLELNELEKASDSLPFSDSKGAFDLWELRNRNPKFGRFNRPNLFFPIYVIPDSKDECGYARVSLEPKEGSLKVLPLNSEGTEGCWRWGNEKISQSDLTSETPVLIGKMRRDGEWNIYEKSRKSTTKAKSIWAETRFISEQGTVELGKINMGDVFSHPKPVALIRQCIYLATGQNDIVMDFFAGSGTTAHATMSINAADSGSRTSILVQMPYVLDPNESEQKNAVEFCDKLNKPRTIAELTKERLRRAGKKIKEENPMFSGDTGFRVFKLDSTNIREWDPNRDNLAESLEASVDHLKANRTDDDILFELLLKLGLDLCVPMEQRTIAGKTVHSIGAGALITCLDISITRADAEPLALGILAWLAELNTAGDSTLVFRDSAFADDVAKTNLSKILEQNGIAAKNIRSL